MKKHLSLSFLITITSTIIRLTNIKKDGLFKEIGISIIKILLLNFKETLY